jgi:hypothetical protein
MNMMEIGVLLVEYSVLEKTRKKAFVREHPDLRNRGVVRWALTAVQMRGRMGDVQAALRHASAAYDLATELNDYQLAAEASDLLAEMR